MIMRFISLILVCLPLVVHSVDESSEGPGSTACLYYGDLATLCNMSALDPSQIPDDCSSIMFKNASPDENFTISLASDSQEEYLNGLLACGKKVFLYYAHLDYPSAWPNALKNNLQDGGECARREMEGLKAFFEQYPGITGLVLYYLDAGVFPDDYSCPTENLQVYLEIMKETFPELIIGLDFATKNVIDFNVEPAGQWLDFSVLDSFIDFYIANTFLTHQCSRKLLEDGGGYPLNGSFAYTVEMALEYAAKANIPKEKCLIQYTTSSTSPDDNVDACYLSNTMLCTKPESFVELCTDSLESYFEKGQYAAENAKGFVLDCLDVDDPDGVCSCPCGPFPAFHALLDGYNGAEKPESCPKYEEVFDIQL